MTFWTLLTIYLLDGTIAGQSRHPSTEACEAATRVVGPTLGHDHLLRCEQTGEASTSIRPRQRPRTP